MLLLLFAVHSTDETRCCVCVFLLSFACVRHDIVAVQQCNLLSQGGTKHKTKQVEGRNGSVSRSSSPPPAPPPRRETPDY